MRATAKIESNLLTAFVKSFEEMRNIYAWDDLFFSSVEIPQSKFVDFVKKKTYSFQFIDSLSSYS